MPELGKHPIGLACHSGTIYLPQRTSKQPTTDYSYRRLSTGSVNAALIA